MTMTLDATLDARRRRAIVWIMALATVGRRLRPRRLWHVRLDLFARSPTSARALTVLYRLLNGRAHDHGHVQSSEEGSRLCIQPAPTCSTRSVGHQEALPVLFHLRQQCSW